MKLTIELPEERSISNDIDWHFVRHEIERVSSVSVKVILKAALAAYEAQRPIEVGDVVTSGGREWNVLAIGSTTVSERALLLAAVDNERLEGIMEWAVKRVTP